MQKNFLKYPVEFVEDLFGENSPLASLVGTHRLFLVADQNVVQHVSGLGTKIGSFVKANSLTLAGVPVVLSGGERVKMDNFQSASRIAEAVLAARLTADDFVLVLGGGTLMDVAGWTVSQLKNPPGLIRVPTTPAAMMGAAFASTASLDTLSVKDAFTVPSVPTVVFLSLVFANSVLDGVWRAGVSEAVRLIAAKAPKLFEKVLSLSEAYYRRDAAALEVLVRTVFELRQKKGETALGLESACQFEPKSNWKLPYGYAVAAGTLLELKGDNAFEAARTMLKTCGALDGLYPSRQILPPEIADFW